MVKNQSVHATDLKYYQGYHDVMSVFLLTLDTNLGYYGGEVASRFILNDFLTLEFEESLIPLSKMVFFLVRKEDEDLYNLVSDHGNYSFPMFATSWILTLFSHDIERFGNLQRLFDFFLSSHPIMIVYFCVGLIKYNKAALEEYVEQTGDVSTATFVVFKTPIRCLNSEEVLEKVLESA